MSLFDRFRKKETPVESSPVISRTGKIGRLGDNPEHNENKPSRMDVIAERNVTISDGGFEKENFAVERRRGQKTHTVKEKDKTPFPIMAVVLSVVCTALFMSVIVNFVQLNEISKDIASMQKTVQNNEKRAAELQADLNDKDNVERLRTYLKDHASEMGMVEESQMRAPTAISPKKGESIDDYEAKEVDDNIMVTALNALANNLINAWNIFVSEE